MSTGKILTYLWNNALEAGKNIYDSFKHFKGTGLEQKSPLPTFGLKK